MNFPLASRGWAWALPSVLILLISLPAAMVASDEAAAEPARPDYATIERALDGDPAAIDALIVCADNDADCRIVAAAALHRQDRTDEAIGLLRPSLARGSQKAALIVAELAFEQEDYRLARAAASIWMAANELELPAGEVDERGVRIPWLIGQTARALSAAELDQARELTAELRPSPGADDHAGSDNSGLGGGEPVPEIASREPPKFPRKMAQTGVGGWAMATLSVAADGRVEDVRELFSSHRAFAGASVDAMRQWRFEPHEDGHRWHLQVIEFNLGDPPSAIPEAESGIPDEEGWIRFDDARGLIEFTVRVNGVPARAMLDTGADANAISQQLVERAGVDLARAQKVRVQGVYGREVVPSTGEFELRFGEASVAMRGAVVLPASSPDLILGVGLFQTGVVQIDYPNKRIRFLNRDAVRFEGNLRVRTRRGRSPEVAAELGGRKIWMLLDTGNAGATLFKSRLLHRLELDQYEIEGSDIPGWGVVSSGEQRLLQLPGFKLGPFQFDTLLASYIEDGAEHGFEERRARAGSRIQRDAVRYDGILGSEVLKNFVITADLENRKVHLAVP